MNIAGRAKAAASSDCEGSRPGKRRRQVIRLVFGLGLFLATLTASAEPKLTEYQVKALFLFNFAKYVDWPAETFSSSNAPIIMGIFGKDNFKEDLQRTIAGKNINGRPLLIRPISADAPLTGCHIVFISASEKSRLTEILAKTDSLPVLTVGELPEFLAKGGVVNFTLKAEQVRLEINLEAARRAKVQISSKLLSVADVVKGKER